MEDVDRTGNKISTEAEMKTSFPILMVAVCMACGNTAVLAAETNTAPATESPAFTAVAKTDRILLRGQPTIFSERLPVQLNKGDTVTVLETITLQKPKEGDETNWFRIALPTNVPVWAAAEYLDTNKMTVTANRLNLRAGPGQNHSVLGRVEKGASLKLIERKNDWYKVEPPPGTYAFVAAAFFEKKETPPPAPPTPPAPPATPPTPPPTPPATPEGTPPSAGVSTAPPTQPDAPKVETNVVLTPPPEAKPPMPELIQQEAEAKERILARIRGHAVTPTPPVTPAATPPPPPPTPPEATTPLPKRVVTREGVVKFTIHVNVPSWYELVSTDTHKVINYLLTTNTNIVLKDFKGKRVIVTGEEALDKRWTNTPVLTIDKIQVVE